MRDRDLRCSRRKFLASAAALTLTGGLTPAASAMDASKAAFRTRPAHPDLSGRRPLAVITTVYRPFSDAYHLAGRFLHGIDRCGQCHVPHHYVGSLYVEQTPENDLSREVAREFAIRRFYSIDEALTHGGSDLAVDGVLLIAEHGNYPRNERGQILYPRYEMFEQIAGVFRKAGRAIPVFIDKHLSYDWPNAEAIVSWGRELQIPLMAGSYLPYTWRKPEWDWPRGDALEEGLIACYGPLEAYGFHGLEALQCLLERRQGNETGVRRVTCLTGKAVWKAGDEGQWSWQLLDAALSRSETLNPGDIRKNVGSLAVGAMPAIPPTALLIDYRDGTRGTVLLLNGHIQDFCFAAKPAGDLPLTSCLFRVPPLPGARAFDCLAGVCDQFFQTRVAPAPIERTLLTTGILAAAMESHYRRGQPVETPHLSFGYAAPEDSVYAREAARPGAPV